MSQPETKVADVDVSAGKDLLRARLLQGLFIIFVPLSLAFAALILVREPALQRAVNDSLGTSLAADRAAAVNRLNESILSRIEALGEISTDTRDQVAQSAMPEALAIRSIPLDQLGTVPLTPGAYGLASHIEIDLVRRAYIGENPPPEAVRNGGAWRLIYARPFDNAGNRGVVLAEMPINSIAELLLPIDSGRFVLTQQADGAATQVIGAPLPADTPFASAQVGNSQWFIRAQVDRTWLTPVLSGTNWLAAAAAVALLGLLLGGLTLMRSVPALLRAESDRILASAENKTSLQVQVPPLLPMARLLRQMALLTRRQIITAARKSLDEPQGGDTPAATELVADAQSVVATTDQEAEIPDHPDDGLPAHIFRSTEIRGRTEDELTDEFMERICKSLAVVAQRRGVQTLAIACDGQGGSDRLRTIAVKTLLASGRDVIDLGAAPAPLLYFATRETEYDSGILITGGRGDEGVNGLRVVMQRQLLTQQGIQEILQGIRDGLQEQGSGRTIKFDVEADYLDKIALDIGVAVPLKIVVDSNFGLAAGLAHEVFGALGCEILSYNDPEQGRVRPEDWAIADALEVLGDKVRSEGADLGLLFDSNGDRLLTVTDQGTAVATDQLMMILGKDFLDRNPGADLVYDVQCTRHFAPFITRSGGRGVMSKSGHANVWAKMVQSKALMGVEYSGHLFLADRWYGFNDAVYAAARLVELLSMSGGSYQDLLSELPGYVSSGVLTVHMDPRERRELLRDLTQEPDFPGSRVTTLDGLRVDYSDSWGLVQASTTYDTLNFRFEGNDEEAMQRVMAVIRKAVQSRMPDLQLPF